MYLQINGPMTTTTSSETLVSVNPLPSSKCTTKMTIQRREILWWDRDVSQRLLHDALKLKDCITMRRLSAIEPTFVPERSETCRRRAILRKSFTFNSIQKEHNVSMSLDIHCSSSERSVCTVATAQNRTDGDSESDGRTRKAFQKCRGMRNQIQGKLNGIYTIPVHSHHRKNIIFPNTQRIRIHGLSRRRQTFVSLKPFFACLVYAERHHWTSQPTDCRWSTGCPLSSQWTLLETSDWIFGPPHFRETFCKV